MNTIKIRGARQHNLKNIDIDIPVNQLVVITGLSGSGKSTLAFDTLYAEGQRRYVESLSAYARHFLERLQKPDADLIEGLSPAIAIEQKGSSHNPRSTLGTITEIYDYLRLLYARIGIPHCHQCGKAISSQSIDEMVDHLTVQPSGTRLTILAPVVQQQKGSHAALIKRHRREGFARLRINGDIVEIENIPALPKNQRHTIEVVVDRIVIKEGIRNRLADSLELALSLSSGTLEALLHPPGIDHAHTVTFSEHAICKDCGTRYPEFTPASFSFNSPHGACDSCSGLGTTATIDPARLVPDEHLSLRQGAVAPWANRQSASFLEFLGTLTDRFETDMDTAFNALPGEMVKGLFYGFDPTESDGKTTDAGIPPYTSYDGLIPQLERRYRETESNQIREEIHRYMAVRSCHDCEGARLRQESRGVKIKNLAIHELTALPLPKALSFLRELRLEGQDARIAEKITRATIQRIEFLLDVGLAYLTLDRSSQTLSGGENQRIRLATQIGSKLCGVLYVLDEPSIGLHQRDHKKLLQALFRIRDLGNSVIVVEHDADTINAADYVIDIGPGAGMKGGHVVFSGPPQALALDETSLTGQYLSGRLSIPVPARRRKGNGHKITLKGATRNNLKTISVDFPLGCLTCVTGVSGSGKSSLVIDTLFKALAHHLQVSRSSNDIPIEDIQGLDHLDKVILIDQSPIGRTPRSNASTYTGLFSFVRDLFSKTAEARARGYKPGRFSFNVKGGRCEACSGDGIVKIEMHFLPDVYVPCDVCKGLRYNRETLEVQYKGKSIAEVLDMTVNQALHYFKNIGTIRTKLETLVDVGLGYIRLGQPATTLSGGEAQRIKLSRELSKRDSGRTIYILDEPTTGLHADDINRLLQVLSRLVDSGNTVVVIEHNLDVIKTADHLIDLGPEGGDGGGFVVATGTPEEIALQKTSYTGEYLKEVLNF